VLPIALPIALAIGGCSDQPAYHPPIVLTHQLARGERVICATAYVWIGLPIEPAPVIAYQRHTFECHLEPLKE
jgi:hypothetical protein